MFKNEKVDKTELKYIIDTELSIENLKFLPEYLRRHYLLKHEKYRIFRNIRIITENDEYYLSYRILVSDANQYVDVTVDASVPIEVMMKLSDPGMPKSFLRARKRPEILSLSSGHISIVSWLQFLTGYAR